MMEINAVFKGFQDNATINVYVGIKLSTRLKCTILHFPIYCKNNVSHSLEDTQFII